MKMAPAMYLPFIITTLASSSHESSDINVCLSKHLPITMYNYGDGQCLSSPMETNDEDMRLQMHGCLHNDHDIFYAKRDVSPYNHTDYYKLVHKLTGKCLTAGPLGHVPVKNTPILQLDCVDAEGQQVWKNYNHWKRPLGSTYYQISNVEESLCLTADQSDPNVPTRGFPYMFPCSYYYNDQWWLPAHGNC